MPDWLETLFDIAAQFTGGRQPTGSNIVWFGISAGVWAALVVVSYLKLRRTATARDRLLFIAFLLGLARELLMMTVRTLDALSWIDSVTLHMVFPPAEHALQNVAMIVIAAAFMRMVTDDHTLSARYVAVGVIAMVICYLGTFWWWAVYIMEHPDSKFGQTWCDMLFHIVMSVLLAFSIAYLWMKSSGWLRLTVCAALSLFGLFVFLKIPDIATDEIHKAIYTPIRHGCYVLAIPLLGYVYVRELADDIERAVVDLREKDRAIATAMQPMAIETLDGRLVYVNEAFVRTWGFENADEIIGRNRTEFAASESEEDTIIKGLYGEGHWSGERIAKKKDGQLFEVRISCAVIKGAEHEPVHMMASFEDITEAKQARSKLLQAERLSAIGQAMTGLVHESRNALARSQSELRMLSRRIDDRPELARYIDGALGAQKDVQELFERVQSYAAPMQLKCKNVCLADLVREVWAKLHLPREHRQVELTLNPSDSALQCEVDPFLLSQVIRNIFENSLAFCTDPLLIEVDISTPTDGVRVSICDNGPGMDEKSKVRVFDAFYTTRTRGTGLGMAISRRIMVEHGGAIELAERTSGTEFILTIPGMREHE